MKLMVGLDENGHFFAYDVSTLGKLKAAWSECVGEPRIYNQKPSVSREEAAQLPEQYKRLAMNDWMVYESELNRKKSAEEFKKTVLAADTEDEFMDLADEYCESNHGEFFLNSRGRCEIVVLR